MNEQTQIVALIGCITGVASLIGLIYAIGFKLGAVVMKVETLWTIYILHPLARAYFSRICQNDKPLYAHLKRRGDTSRRLKN